MVEVLQDSFNNVLGGNTSVEDFIKLEKNYIMVNDFLNGVGNAKLIVYFQQENAGQDFEMRDMQAEAHLMFTNGENEKLTGKGSYFLRTCQGKVNCNDIDGEVIYGEIKDDTLKQLNIMISSVFIPLIRSMDNRSDWRECDEEQKKKSLLELLINFLMNWMKVLRA